MNQKLILVLSALSASLLLAACEKAAPPADPAVDTAATEAAAEDPRTAELAAREEELAKREEEMAMKEREAEVAKREAEIAARERAVKKASAPKPAPAPVAAAAPPPAKAAEKAPEPIVLASGTQISAELVRQVTTKTAMVGDMVEARLVSDLMVDGRKAAPAGSLIQGSVTRVVSGSKVIGGIPTLALSFHKLTVDSGDVVDIQGQVTQQGKSDKGRDTAKIAGGAVAGAVLGHQVDDGKGKLIGGLLGAAAGAAAAQKTGTEVDLPAGTVVVFDLERSVQTTR